MAHTLMSTVPVSEALVEQRVHQDGHSGEIVEYRVGNRVGEGPTWDAAAGLLRWIDVRAQQLLQLDPDRSRVMRWHLEEPVGAMAPCTSRRAVLALRRHLAVLDLDSGDVRELAVVDNEPLEGNRLNDGQVSPSGRWFVFGSMDDGDAPKQPRGNLYVLGTGGQVRLLHHGLAVANGIAFSPDAKRLYFSDSQAGQVWVAAWNEDSGEMGPPHQFLFSGEERGRPDGALVNRRGHYVSAGVSAGRLNRFDEAGLRLPSVPLPCRAPTMACYGGSALQWWFVTSLVRPQWTPAADSADGSLLRLRSDGLGLPAPQLQLN